MKLPNQTAVHRDAANPSAHRAGSVERDAADPVRRERGEHLLPRGVEILPVLGSVSERVAKKRGRLLDEIRRVWRQIDDVRILPRQTTENSLDEIFLERRIRPAVMLTPFR